METRFTEDQGGVLKAIQAGEHTQMFRLQDGREILVYQGAIVGEAVRQHREPLSTINTGTLASLSLLVAERLNVQANVIVKVESTRFVSVTDVLEPEKHQRIFTASADLPDISLLRSYVPLETALIELRKYFRQDLVTEKLSKQLSKVTVEDVTEIEDNGIGTNVTVHSRVQGREQDATVFNLKLTPYRTFPELFEADEVVTESDFVVPGTFTMRWKKQDKELKVALVEQGYVRWEFQQMQKIAEYLQSLLPEATLIVV